MQLIASDGSVEQSYDAPQTFIDQLHTKFNLVLDLPPSGEHIIENWNPQPILDTLDSAKTLTDALPGFVRTVPRVEPISSPNTILQLMNDTDVSHLQQNTVDGVATASYTRNEYVTHPDRDPLLAQIAQLREFFLTFQLGGYILRIA